MGRIVPKKFTEEGNVDRKQKISKRQEKKVAKLSGGVRTPASGSKGIKGDVVRKADVPYGKRRKIECKTTDKASISVKQEWIDKLQTQAHQEGAEPVLVFGFTAITFGSQNWGAVPYERLEELFEIERKYYEEE